MRKRKINYEPIPYLSTYDFENYSQKERFRRTFSRLLLLRQTIKEHKNLQEEIVREVELYSL